MNKTSIEWVKNPDGTQGYTWNPITGCLNHTEGMCKGGGFPCYAYKLANGRLKSRYLANTKVADIWGQLHDMRSPLWDRVTTDPFYARFWEDRLEEPVVKYKSTKAGYIWKPQKARGIFCCDMSDLFGIGIPEEWTRKVLNIIDYCVFDRFYLLTKQPQNLIKFSPFPENCWVGVTATNWLRFSDALGHLATIEAEVKYLSLEPLLERIQLDMLQTMLFPGVIGWVIIGAQTKPYKPPKVEWVQEIVEACDKAGVAVFLKENLRPLLNKEAWRNTLLWGNSTGKPRQELPNV